MKILLLGKNGQVGWELQRTLATLGDLVAMDQKDLDLVDGKAIQQSVQEIRPHLIVNAAAYTAVDKAEEEHQLAMAINATAPGILAQEAKKINAALIHYSTDYVFDGTKREPYNEEDKPNPINIYGKTKLAGEKAIQEVGAPYLIFRTSWVYGMRGKNFLLTMLKLARERKEIGVVDDQFGSPTWCRMIAEITAQIVARGNSEVYDYIDNHSGIYNLTSSGSTSWYGFTKTILGLDPNRQEQKCRELRAITTEDFPTPAKRPKYSVLEKTKLKETFNLNIPLWDQQLAKTLERLG